MNWTIANEFILLGFSKDLRVNILLFLLFLGLYLVTVFGNLLIMSLIVTSPTLHTPMYFFLCVLSLVDLSMSTTVVPQLLTDLFSTRRLISLDACAIQLYTILLMSGTECFLLSLMAYDRYLAICRPLHYPILMRWSNCFRLTASVWTVSFLVFIIPPLFMPLDLCYPNHINHFMCEVLAIIQLACDDIYLSEVVMFVTCFIGLLIPFVCIIASYTCIIFSVLKIHSTRRSKAFSTCTSHITVVILFYGTAMTMYFSPSSQYSTSQGKYLSLFSYIICPSLNPLIYSLNNKEVKDASRKLFTPQGLFLMGDEVVATQPRKEEEPAPSSQDAPPATPCHVDKTRSTKNEQPSLE
ncbi:olfactory receptor 2D2-like [Leptodactylus fuscus]|uniref:olfactory receptor 2D2-like n=1 Tax=Leptodactylus fuscus TaxID=238119 RepID=UPI003F4E5833